MLFAAASRSSRPSSSAWRRRVTRSAATSRRCCTARNSTADRKRFRLRNSLVVAQVALSLMLVVIAFLFVRTLQAATTIDPGFNTANVEIASVDVSLSGYREQNAVVTGGAVRGSPARHQRRHVGGPSRG